MMSPVENIGQELIDFMKDFIPLGQKLAEVSLFTVLTLLAVVLIPWLEGRLAARIRMRRGKNLKQSVAEIFKYLFKESIVPERANAGLFFTAPLLAFVLCLFLFLFLPMRPERTTPRLELGLLYLLFAGSFGIYTFILGGWSSGSRFGFLGAVRAFAQTLSCQLVLTLAATVVLMSAGSANLSAIVAAQDEFWYIVPHFPVFVLFILCCSMMLAQAPFEGPKSQKELASGIYSEYSGTLYFFFLCADRILLLLAAVLGTILFLGGWQPVFAEPGRMPPFVWLAAKTVGFLFILIMVRTVLPSYRTDQLMRMSYKIFLPFAVIWVFLTAAAVLAFGGGAA